MTHAGPIRSVLTEEVIGAVYGVRCRVLPVGDGDHVAIYPMAVL